MLKESQSEVARLRRQLEEVGGTSDLPLELQDSVPLKQVHA